MFYLSGEPGYITTNWYKHITDGIFEEKRTKRFDVAIVSGEEITGLNTQNDDAILLVGSNLGWLESIMDICCRKFGRNIIVLGNFEYYLNGKIYSIVSSDISADIYNLCSYLSSYGKNKIAVYGINPNSASDAYRKNCFIKCGGFEKDVYYNNANIKECYEKFVMNIDQYDAVICANDYLAISLVRSFRKDGIKMPFIVSCGETKLAIISDISITNLKTSYKDFAKAAINIYKILRKDFSASRIKIELASCIVPGDTTENMPVKIPGISGNEPINKIADDSFYHDEDVSEMMKIEKLLDRCDKNEFDMLISLINGMTYPAMAEKYHMSVNGVKYKLNKLFELCGVHSKSEFTALIKKYIN